MAPALKFQLVILKVVAIAWGGTAVADDYAAEILADGPVVFYRFEEPAAEPASGTAVALADSAAAAGRPQFGNQQAINHGPFEVGDGALIDDATSSNRAAVFNGARRLAVPLPADLDVLDLTGPFTLEFWIRPSGSGSETQQFLGKGDFLANSDETFTAGRVSFFILYVKSTGILRFGFADGSGAARGLDSTKPLAVGKWSHVVATYDLATKKAAIYINGRRNAQRSLQLQPPSFPGQDLTIGALTYDSSKNQYVHFFHGALDELALYDYVLTPKRIAGHYAAGTGLDPATIRVVQDGESAVQQASTPRRRRTAPEITVEDRAHWAFQPLSKPEPPGTQHEELVRNPIDAFLLARLEAAGLTFASEADRRQLIRRAYFDLVGLPPTPEQTAAFVADEDPRAFEALVDQLLDSDDFGVRWGRHWLDMVGYTDTMSFDDDYGPPIGFTKGKWRYRDYVVRSLNDGKPLDHFISQQLAGDEQVRWRDVDHYTPEILESLEATGYLRCCEDITLEDPRPFIVWSVLHDTVTQLGTSMLGLSLSCARCHDHKNEPVSQEEYYQLLSMFAPAMNAVDFPAHWKNPQQRALPDISQSDLAELNKFNGQVDKQVGEINNQIGEIQKPYREQLVADKVAAVAEEDRENLRAALDVAADQRDEAQKAVVAKYEKEIAVSDEELTKALSEADTKTIEEFQQQIAELNGKKRSHGWIMGMADVGPPPATRIFDRGEHLRPAEEVLTGFPRVLSNDFSDWLLTIPPTAETSRRRTALARWLTDRQSPASPLVARVMVNRVWQRLLGRGIAPTVENLGTSGTPPTHPELLEWLSYRFVENGWHLKPLIKEIMMSAAYRQATSGLDAPSAELAREADPGNDLLWRAPLRRIEAEVIRDTMLQVSGKLDTTMGGPPVALTYDPDGRVTVARAGTSHWRRSLYLLNRRIYNPSFLNVFDKPIMTGCVCQREQAAVPLQSLALMNDGFVMEQARYLADRVKTKAGDSVDAQIESVYRLALGRAPVDEEHQWSQQLIEQQTEIYASIESPPEDVATAALASLCQTVMSTNEFLYLD